MTDLLIKFHRLFYEPNNKYAYKKNNVLLWLLTNLMFRFAETLLNYWVRFKYIMGFYTMPNKNHIQEGLVVSLTSFPSRINIVWMTIDSIFRQTLQPECVNLYLSKMQFPKQFEDLPDNLLKMQSMGLNIIFVEDDLKPHKKYYYAFNEYSDKCIVTIDDDIYYRSDLLKHLWTLHLKFPHCVVANQGVVFYNISDSYSSWRISDNARMKPLHNAVAIGCGGILYPCSLLKNNEIYDKKLIKELSLSTDDLWLKVHELKNDIKVVIGEYFCISPNIVGSQKKSLSNKNWQNDNQNDINWSNLVDYYELPQLLNHRGM